MLYFKTQENRRFSAEDNTVFTDHTGFYQYLQNQREME